MRSLARRLLRRRPKPTRRILGRRRLRSVSRKTLRVDVVRVAQTLGTVRANADRLRGRKRPLTIGGKPLRLAVSLGEPEVFEVAVAKRQLVPRYKAHDARCHSV